MSNVIKMVPDQIGENFRFDADEMLEAAKGQGFQTLVILGQCEDGELWVTSNSNLGETICLIEIIKHKLLLSD